MERVPRGTSDLLSPGSFSPPLSHAPPSLLPFPRAPVFAFIWLRYYPVLWHSKPKCLKVQSRTRGSLCREPVLLRNYKYKHKKTSYYMVVIVPVLTDIATLHTLEQHLEKLRRQHLGCRRVCRTVLPELWTLVSQKRRHGAFFIIYLWIVSLWESGFLLAKCTWKLLCQEINLIIYKEAQTTCWLCLISLFPWRLGNLEKLGPVFLRILSNQVCKQTHVRCVWITVSTSGKSLKE